MELYEDLPSPAYINMLKILYTYIKRTYVSVEENKVLWTKLFSRSEKFSSSNVEGCWDLKTRIGGMGSVEDVSCNPRKCLRKPKIAYNCISRWRKFDKCITMVVCGCTMPSKCYKKAMRIALFAGGNVTSFLVTKYRLRWWIKNFQIFS